MVVLRTFFYRKQQSFNYANLETHLISYMLVHYLWGSECFMCGSSDLGGCSGGVGGKGTMSVVVKDGVEW